MQALTPDARTRSEKGRKNTRRLCTVLLLAVVSSGAHAGVREQIAAIEAHRATTPPVLLPGFPSGPVARVSVPRLMRLPDGREADLRGYALVVFMQQHCPYSAKFDPKLRAWADGNGMKVYPYTLDGDGDVSFPHPLVPRRAGPGEPVAGEILTFFGSGLPIATPTTFLVNVSTNTAYPLVQGDTDMPVLGSRVAQMIAADLDHVTPDQTGPLPAGQGMTLQ